MSLQEDLEKMDEEETAYQAKRKAKLAEEKRKRDREAKDHRRKLAAKQEKLYAEYAKQVIPIMGALCKRDGVDYTSLTPSQVMATPAKAEQSQSVDDIDYKAIVTALSRRDAVDYTGLRKSQLAAVERGEQVSVDEDPTAGRALDELNKLFKIDLRELYAQSPEGFHKMLYDTWNTIHPASNQDAGK